MYQPQPCFPPLFPSCNWWRNRLVSILDGASLEESALFANNKTGMRNRDWMRFEIKDDCRIALISIPVCGGASALKNRNPDGWMLSPKAGQALDVMDKTLATLYGSEPYFPYIFPEISLKEAFDYSGEVTADSFCSYADGKICRLLGFDDINMVETARKALSGKSAHFTEKCNASRDACREELSIIDALLRSGPETIFALLPTF